MLLGKMLALTLMPLVLSIVLGRYFSESDWDGWLMVSIGVAGSLCVIAMAYVDHCIKKSDEREEGPLE